jgi:hypothetical protein
VVSTSPAIADDGTVIATVSNRLFVICGTNGPGNNPWPMWGQNARRTGKVEGARLAAPQKRADANFEIAVSSQLGVPLKVETSTNLETWSSLSNLVPETLPAVILDPTATNHPWRFYRATLGPP